jgi:hypothetical protein
MNASAIFGQDEDTMTLEEKLAAIDRAMQAAQEQASEEAAARGQLSAPLDPASLTICDGCE